MENQEENLVLTEQMAKELYENAPESMKRVFETTFKNTFNVKITDRIKNFDDVLDVYLKTYELSEIEKIIIYYNGDNSNVLNTQAFEKLKIIASVLNQSWVPDWANGTEIKWYPWFKMAPFAFDGTNIGLWLTYSSCGSHLCFQTEELAIFAGKIFTDIYKIAYTK